MVFGYPYRQPPGYLDRGSRGIQAVESAPSVQTYLPRACSSLSVRQRLVACATRLSFSSVMSHSTRPTVRPCLTTRPTARNRAFQIGLRKLILSSSVVNDSPSSRFAE